MDVILDLDLDFFVWPIFHDRKGPKRVHPSRISKLYSEQETRLFLEQGCGLSTENPVYCEEVEEHDEAFDVWRIWLKDGSLRAPFKVIHVDAHADQGIGDRSWRYLLTEFLCLPLSERANPPRGKDRMNAGNYLMFAVANRWLESLMYVHPTNPAPPLERPVYDPDTKTYTASSLQALHFFTDFEQAEPPDTQDLIPQFYRDGNISTNLIELCCRDPGTNFNKTLGTPIHKEPPVSFERVPDTKFRFRGFSHMVIARSPGYTPKAADKLMPIIREYVRHPFQRIKIEV